MQVEFFEDGKNRKISRIVYKLHLGFSILSVNLGLNGFVDRCRKNPVKNLSEFVG